MTDLILHRLTNRANDFTSAVFPMASPWRPAVLTPEAVRVRQVMGLDVRQTDFFVVGVHAALDAFAELLELLPDAPRSYVLQDWRPAPDIVEGAELLSGPKGAPRLLYQPTSWPPPFVIELKRVDASYAILSWDGRSALVHATATGSQLMVEWPEDCGVYGTVEMREGFGWSGESVLRFRVTPKTFPYATCARALVEAREKDGLLIQAGLSAAFSNALEPIEKVAVMAAALVLTHPEA